MIFPGAVVIAEDAPSELYAISSMLVRTWQTAYLYAIVFSCRCASPLAARPPPARSLPLPLLLRSAASSACKPAGGANAHCQARRGADLDLITMWFIELPAGTSLWEYTSVRQQLAVPAESA